MAVRPRPNARTNVWRGATEAQNQKKRREKRSGCDVLTGIPASKANEGSEGKRRARGSLPQRHTLTHTHLRETQPNERNCKLHQTAGKDSVAKNKIL